jgi:putative phosphoesterase
MRILLVADIHANWAALQQVATLSYDVVLCLGDLVDYGVEPAPCLQWVRQHALHTVRGNHDHGAAQNVTVAARTGYKYLTATTRTLTRELLSTTDLRYLGRLPTSKMVTIDNTRILLVHASPRDPLDEYAPADPEFWARHLQNVDADIICVGHTHQPYFFEVGDKVVINPGSVGQPRDGDPRASCAILENNEVELLRLEYPIEDTVAAVQASSLPGPARDRLVEIYRHGTLTGNHRPS